MSYFSILQEALMFKKSYHIVSACALLIASGLYPSESAVTRRGKTGNGLIDKTKAVLAGGAIVAGAVLYGAARYYAYGKYKISNGYVEMPDKKVVKDESGNVLLEGSDIVINTITKEYEQKGYGPLIKRMLRRKPIRDRHIKTDYDKFTRNLPHENKMFDLHQGYGQVGWYDEENNACQVYKAGLNKWDHVEKKSTMDQKIRQMYAESQKPNWIWLFFQSMKQRMLQKSAKVIYLGGTKAWKKKDEQTWHIEDPFKKVEKITRTTENGHPMECIEIDGAVYYEDNNIWYKLVRRNDGRLVWEKLVN